MKTVKVSDNSAIVENVLVSVCNNCDAVVALPQQSAEKVNETINKVS